MKLIIMGRQEGKTTELIKEASKLSGYNLIVCFDRREASRLWKIILENKYSLPQPISFGEFLNGQFSSQNINTFLIDNVDMLLQQLSKGVKIHAVSFNKDDI